MPLLWEDPEIALIHRGVRIYHMYKNDDSIIILPYHYSFGTRQDDPSFDVRDHRCPHDRNVHGRTKNHPDIIRLAIERGDLEVPKECQPDCKHENLIVSSYRVANADAQVTLSRDANTGRVFDFEFNRIDGEVGEPVFCCTDCEEALTWVEVLNF